MSAALLAVLLGVACVAVRRARGSESEGPGVRRGRLLVLVVGFFAWLVLVCGPGR